MSRHWTDRMACPVCGWTTTNPVAEAKHRHNFPILCRLPEEVRGANWRRITQAYLRRYPSSRWARAWAFALVHIETEHGVWRENAAGYTTAGAPDAWVLPFEEAKAKVSHCGPEKRAAFIRTKAKPRC